MPVPSFIDASAGATDAGGAWSFTCQAPEAAGRVFIVHILQDGATSGAVQRTSASNIERLDGTDNDWSVIYFGAAVGSVSSPTAFHHLFIGRSLSTSAPTIGGSNSTSEDLYFRSYQFTDVKLGSSVRENGGVGAVAEAGTGATVSDAIVETLGPDRLALNFIAINDDNAISDFTGETGGNWALATSPYAEASGTDGAIGLQIAPAAGGTVLQEASESANGIGLVSGSEYRAQSFIPLGSGTLIDPEIRLGGNIGTPTDSLILEIRSDNAGVPSTTVLASKTLTHAELVADTWNTFALTLALSAGVRYWIVVHRSGGLDVNNYRTWRVSLLNPYTAGGSDSSSDGSTWTDAHTNDYAFRVPAASEAITINGGTFTQADATDGWGVVGFALQPEPPPVTNVLPGRSRIYVPRYLQNPGRAKYA